MGRVSGESDLPTSLFTLLFPSIFCSRLFNDRKINVFLTENVKINGETNLFKMFNS